jgi:hypothetical protein
MPFCDEAMYFGRAPWLTYLGDDDDFPALVHVCMCIRAYMSDCMCANSYPCPHS